MFCACSRGDVNEGDDIIPNLPPWNLVIIDSELNDRFNPESPTYFGVEYIQKIDVLTHVLYTEELVSIGGMWRDVLENSPYYAEDLSKMIGPVLPPGLTIPTYFSIPLSYGGTYVRYPDGSEDIILFQGKQIENGGGRVSNIILINGELAYDSKSGLMEDLYYNPKFFPLMAPCFDEHGVQHGWMPEVPFVIIITK